MERGLLWLPLLVLFFWLAWAGWNEYQKLEAYKVWAQGFERSKYDILAAAGQQGDVLSWGRPTRSGPTHLQTVERQQIASLQLWVDGQAVPLTPETIQGKTAHIALQLHSPNADEPLLLPFTDVDLAVRWAAFLQGWTEEAETEAEAETGMGDRPAASEPNTASDVADA
jgi:hypothetical protein